MRNAAAPFDDDFDLREPARKKGGRRTSSGGKKKAKRGFRFSWDMKKVARYAAVGMSAALALGIMVNALVLQKGHHPAPLFGTSIALGEKPPAPRPVATPRPAPDVPDEAPMPVAKPPAMDNTEAPVAASGDQIAQLLQGGPIPAERPDPKTVLGVQRALVKLGFVLKPTGTFGPQTKKALELFEKDRHLPVSGELTHRIVKVLAAESGLKITY